MLVFAIATFFFTVLLRINKFKGNWNEFSRDHLPEYVHQMSIKRNKWYFLELKNSAYNIMYCGELSLSAIPNNFLLELREGKIIITHSTIERSLKDPSLLRNVRRLITDIRIRECYKFTLYPSCSPSFIKLIASSVNRDLVW